MILLMSHFDSYHSQRWGLYGLQERQTARIDELSFEFGMTSLSKIINCLSDLQHHTLTKPSVASPAPQRQEMFCLFRSHAFSVKAKRPLPSRDHAILSCDNVMLDQGRVSPEGGQPGRGDPARHQQRRRHDFIRPS